MKYSLSALEDEVNKETRTAALKVLRGVTFATPVDTGRAKGNWQTSLSAPIGIDIQRLDRSGQAAIAAGTSEIGKAKEIKYPEIWIVNNLPYIEKLNGGSSTQAPAKFVESVIQKAVNK
jgi:hypothetical protein